MKTFPLLLAAVLIACQAFGQFGTRLTNASGASIAQYDVVVIDTSGTLRIKKTTTAADATVVGITYEAIANSATGTVTLPGSISSVNVTGTVAIGDALITSTTSGRARTATTNAEKAAAFGVAMSANASGTGTIKCAVNTMPVAGSLNAADLVYGPASSTDNAIVRFDGTTGKLVINSTGVLDDTGALTGVTANANVITAGTVATARLGSGTANNLTFLRGDSTWAAPTATLADADFGDITVSSSGTVMTIDNTTVTYAKMQAIGANKLLGNDGSGSTVEEIALTSAGRALIDDSDATAQRTTLGLAIGTNVQAYDAELAAIASTTSAADTLPYYTGSGTASTTAFTSAGRALIDDADAAAQRTTLGGIVLGAASSTDNAIARFDSTGGKTIQNSGITISDANDVAGITTIRYTGTSATISSGAISITSSFVSVDTEGAAASDDLDTINGGADGMLLVLCQTNTARDVTVKNNTGNVRCGTDLAFNTTSDAAIFVYRASNGGWKKIGNASN